MLRLALILLCLLAIPLHANMGDTIAQCVARYGKPVGFSEASPRTPFGTLVFTSSSYTLVVFLLGEKEVGARVAKTDKTAFTAGEMQIILNADSAGGAWTTTSSDDPTCLRWTRPDKATALYDKEKFVMIFTSPTMAAAIQSPPPLAPASAPSRVSATTNAAPPAPSGN